MHEATRDELVAAIASTLRADLSRRHAVEVPYIGTFRIVHRASEIHENEDGSVVVTPPRDEVTFNPGPDWS